MVFYIRTLLLLSELRYWVSKINFSPSYLMPFVKCNKMNYQEKLNLKGIKIKAQIILLDSIEKQAYSQKAICSNHFQFVWGTVKKLLLAATQPGLYLEKHSGILCTAL